MKALLVECCLAAGWAAEPEVAGEGWRADVLATSPDFERRVVFEVQLSSQPEAVTQERTDLRVVAGAQVVWVTTKFVPWQFQHPTLRVSLDDRTATGWIYRPRDALFGWDRVPPVDVFTVIHAVLGEELVTHSVPWLFDEEPWGQRTRSIDEHNAIVWVSARRLERARAARAVVDAEQRKREESEARRQALYEANLDAWLGRQRVTVERLKALGAIEMPTSPQEWKFGRGVLMRFPEERTLMVVCPVASQIWKRAREYLTGAGVMIIAADDRDAVRLRRVLPNRSVELIDDTERKRRPVPS